MKSIRFPARSGRLQHGFTMVELMVALLIGLFLMGGLVTLMQNNKRAFSSQALLAQLQDSERLATTMMTDVIQQTGYFPDPTLNTTTSAFPAAAPFAVGQSLYGFTTTSGSNTSDTIKVRYTTATGDKILNCSGGSNATGVNDTYINAFSVILNPAGVYQLVCTLTDSVAATTTAYPLVNNVQSITALYGVNTTGSNGNVDTYMTAAQVSASAAGWNNVISVQVTLTFLNPLYGTATQAAAGQSNAGQPASFVIQRNISIMNQVE